MITSIKSMPVLKVNDLRVEDQPETVKEAIDAAREINNQSGARAEVWMTYFEQPELVAQFNN